MQGRSRTAFDLRPPTITHVTVEVYDFKRKFRLVGAS